MPPWPKALQLLPSVGANMSSNALMDSVLYHFGFDIFFGTDGSLIGDGGGGGGFAACVIKFPSCWKPPGLAPGPTIGVPAPPAPEPGACLFS